MSYHCFDCIIWDVGNLISEDVLLSIVLVRILLQLHINRSTKHGFYFVVVVFC